MAEQPVLWRAYVMPTGSDFTLPEHETSPSAVDITLQLSSTADAGSTVAFTLTFDGSFPGVRSAAVSMVHAAARDGTPSLVCARAFFFTAVCVRACLPVSFVSLCRPVSLTSTCVHCARARTCVCVCVCVS